MRASARGGPDRGEPRLRARPSRADDRSSIPTGSPDDARSPARPPILDADPLTARPHPPPTQRTQANAHLLATCYYRADQANRAYHTLKGRTSPRCRYLFALCCVKLRRLPEAEAALCRSPLPAGGRPPATDASAAERPAANAATSDVPNGAHGLYLLGRVCKETGRDKAAAAHFADALALDPFMWCAYEELCALGAEAEAEAATEAAARSADRYPKLAEALKLAGRGFGGAAESTSFGTGTNGGEISSAATDSEGTSGLSGGGGGGLGGAHSGASSNPNHALGGILGTVAEGTPTTTPRASSLGFAKPPSGSGLPSGAPSASGAVPMSTGGESAYHGAYGDERTPAPDSTRGLMPPAPPSTATAAGVPADDLVTPAPAGRRTTETPGPPGGPGGGGGGGGGRGDGGRRKFVDEGKLRKVSGQLFQESAKLARGR